jgi:hypothetical protein
MEISFIRRYCTSILLTAALSLAASSCSKVYDINRTTSPQFAADFVEGRTELSRIGQGGGWYFNEMKLLWKQQNWQSLSKLVISVDARLDYTWFLLGESARGLGLNDAAAIYYKKALIDMASSDEFAHCHRDRSLFGEPPDSLCEGFVFPRDINRGLAALQTAAEGPR